MERRKSLLAMGTLLIGVIVVATYNYIRFEQPLHTVIESDERNKGLVAYAHGKWFLDHRILVFDLRGVDGSKSQLDVMRVLLKYAEAQQGRDFSRVELVFRGTPKFAISGEAFKTLGRDFATQNPMYLLRTFPESVLNLDGSHAFGTWSGGVLGVLQKQMEDLGKFSRDWYVQDLVSDHTEISSTEPVGSTSSDVL